MILVTHDLGVVAGHTDEIIVMYAGQIVEQAPTPVLFSEMRMPYTEALLESIPKLDDPSHTRLAGHRRPAARPDQPADGLPVRPRCPYVQDRCRTEEPPLVEAETPGHLYACWYPVGSTSGRRPRHGWPSRRRRDPHGRHRDPRPRPPRRPRCRRPDRDLRAPSGDG